jgi:hypothetical protein
VDFQQLSLEDNLHLIAPFTVDEIKEAVWSCDGNKSPGPDGFNLNFFKSCWNVLEKDIVDFMNEFHTNSKLPKAITSSFLTLIPKKDMPQSLNDFRPISLIGSLYKILAKVLAARLKEVIGKLIDPVQSAFAPGRNILDGVLIVNEILDLAKRRKDSCLLLKVDFEKAYDTVNWSFLKYMLGRMGFDRKWIDWMMTCVCSNSISVLVNGSPTEEFVAQRGLRQGDPLAPFLFLIVAEGLAGLMRSAVRSGSFAGYKVHDSLSYNLLQFADDTIILCDGTWVNLWVIKAILRSFELVSGLKVNFHKSNLFGLNLERRFMEAASNFLSCKVGAIPFKFLGIPVGANPRSCKTWQPILDLMEKRLAKWKGKHLSIGGRVVLINSVLSSLPLYFFSFFKAPKKIIQEIIKIQRNFLWSNSADGRRVSWLSWDSVCLPKKLGGLGVKHMELFNMALIAKWRWRCLTDINAAWFPLLLFRYGDSAGHHGLVFNGSTCRKDSIWWRDLCLIDYSRQSCLNWFSESVVRRIGDGTQTRFWDHKWCGNICIKDKFQRLYSLATCKDDVVTDLLKFNGDRWVWSWHWRRPLLAWEEEQLIEMEEALDGTSLLEGTEDKWVWTHDAAAGFSVKSAYLILQSRCGNSSYSVALERACRQLWRCSVPSKFLVHGWRVLHKRLATKDALLDRGIFPNQIDPLCVFCEGATETCNHMLFSCPFAYGVWLSVYGWLGFDGAYAMNGVDHFLQHGSLFGGKKWKKIKHLVWLATVWSLWISRNKVIFEGKDVSKNDVLSNVKLLSWSWFIYRAGLKLDCSYSEWCSRPAICMELIG